MEKSKNNPPVWFWVFALPMLILGVMGILQVNSVWGEEMTEPLWAQIGYTLGIFGIFLGSLFLVLQKRVATQLYAVSAAGFLIHRFWLFALSGTVDTLATYAPITLFISVMLDLLGIWVARKGSRAGWIR